MAEQKQTNKERLREITESIEQGIKELFESDKYMEYLRVMSRFHSYSRNNVMLIKMQMPGATRVAGFNKWRDQFGRHVKKGEKSIKIIAPTPYKKKIEEIKRDPDTKAPILDQDGKAIIEEKEVSIPTFRVVSVFDVSQTDGKPLPQLASDLIGNVQDYEIFMEALRRSSPVPLEMKPLQESMDGFFDPENQSITLRADMSEVQTVSAAIHEITHAKLHNYEKERLAAAAGEDGQEPPKPKDRNTEEVEAESVSYAVCQYYGIQTGENSFGYIANWSSGKELPELKASLDTIQKTAGSLISDIDRNFMEICKERGIDPAALEPAEMTAEELAAAIDTFSYGFDTYEYWDSVDDREVAVDELTRNIQNGNTSYLKEWLQSIVDEDEIPENVAQAQKLITELARFEAPQKESHRYYITQEALDKGTYPVMEGSQVNETPELHSYENSRIQAYGYIDYPETLTQEQISESGLVPAEVAAAMMAEKLYVLDDTTYLHLQTSEAGYDYTLYDVNTLRELDGGQLDAPTLPFSTACLKICEMHEVGSQSIKYAPLSMIETLQNAAYQQLQEQRIEPEPENPKKSYMAHANPRATGEQDRYYIQAYDSTPGGPIPAEIVSYGTKEMCVEVAEQLNSGVLSRDEALKRLEGDQTPELSDQAAASPVQQETPASAEEMPPASMLPDAPEQALDQYPMPDEALRVADLEASGYLDGDMLPLSKERAMELFEKELTVYAVVNGGSAEMLFDREDFDTQAPEVLFAVSREEWEASPLFHEKIMERHDHQEEREAAFLAHTGDCFAIYQLKRDDSLRDIRYEGMDWLKSIGRTVEHSNYDLVYTAPLPEASSVDAALDQLDYQFNNEHPVDYHHPSLSVSDIVAVKQNGVVSCHYCDSFGFREVPGFLPQDNPLKNAEMAMEDDYGMIDGIINNGPKEPTIAELEMQARSGQPISLMDLADAVHREQREKKKSVVEQLRNQPKQEHKKTAPKKSAEREL